MKKILYAALAATTLFASCSKDDSQGGSSNPGEKAKLTITIANPSSTRATGANTENTDMGVANYVAIAVDANGLIVGSAATTGTGSIAGLETTTAAKRLLVISNLNATLVSGTELLSTITTMAGLEAAIDGVADLANGSAPRLSNTANSIWSAGEAAIDWSGTLNTAEDAYEEAVTVTIRPVAAKVSLKVTVPEEYSTALAGNFKMDGANEGVLVLNAVSKTKFFGAKAFESYTETAYPWLVPAAKAYYSGIAVTGFDYGSDASEVKSFLQDSYTYSATPVYFNYYLFENDADKATDFSTVVTLNGTWGKVLTAGDFKSKEDYSIENQADYDKYVTEAIDFLKPRPVYFPIHLTSLDAGSGVANYGKGVQRGKCYNISLELTADVFTGDYKFPTLPIQTLPIVPPITPPDDPTTEIAAGLVNVTVSVVNWVGVDINKEW